MEKKKKKEVLRQDPEEDQFLKKFYLSIYFYTADSY